MKFRKLLAAMLLTGLVALGDMHAQTRPWQKKPTRHKPAERRPIQPRPPDSAFKDNTVELNLGYDFTVPGDTSRIEFVVALPKTMPDKQKILGITYSPKPSKVFHENGNRYAEYVFVKPNKRFKVKIGIKAELSRYDLFTARRKYAKAPPESESYSLNKFLRQEQYIEKDHSHIQQIAETMEGQTQTDTVKQIYKYVIDNLEYIIQGEEDLGAVRALENKKGDCSEYSDLFVAICRAKNIPARVATGYTVRSDDVSPKHHWVEVYLEKYGWVPFDPSWGDVESTVVRNRAFDRMKPVYLYLSHIRNDHVLHNKHFFAYLYLGDKVQLKDTIEFKQHAESQPNSR
ncbi:MAG: transglutaminase-like domain-containing protein [Planctomycetota bacterium]|jgi:transglutaminase-like putative cysteine protease